MPTEAELKPIKTREYQRFQNRDGIARRELWAKMNELEARGYNFLSDHPLHDEAERASEAYQQARRIAWLDYKTKIGQEPKE